MESTVEWLSELKGLAMLRWYGHERMIPEEKTT